MLKRFKDLNTGDFFKCGRYVYIKTYEFEGVVDGNCIIISKALAGNHARLTDEDVVEHLPDMKH